MSIFVLSKATFTEEFKPFTIFSNLDQCIGFLKQLTHCGDTTDDIFININEKMKYKITEIPDIVIDPIDYGQVVNYNVRGYLAENYGTLLAPIEIDALVILEHNNIPLPGYQSPIRDVQVTPPPNYRQSPRTTPQPPVYRTLPTDRRPVVRRGYDSPTTPQGQQNLVDGMSPSPMGVRNLQF